MIISILSETKFLKEHQSVISILRRNRYATKDYGPYTKDHKTIMFPIFNEPTPSGGRGISIPNNGDIRLVKSDLLNLINDINIGYLPKLWQSNYQTLGYYGLILSDDIDVKNIVENTIFKGISNISLFNPNIDDINLMKNKIDIYFNNLTIQKSIICK